MVSERNHNHRQKIDPQYITVNVVVYTVDVPSGDAVLCRVDITADTGHCNMIHLVSSVAEIRAFNSHRRLTAQQRRLGVNLSLSTHIHLQ